MKPSEVESKTPRTDAALEQCIRHGSSNYDALIAEAKKMEADLSARQQEPVAWRCHDYGDDWILYHAEHRAKIYQEKTGCLMQPLYAAPPALPADQWLPIESAPRDGTRLLAVVNGAVRIIAHGKTSHVPIYGWCLADQGAEDFDICHPTAWQPLPPAPRSEK